MKQENNFTAKGESIQKNTVQSADLKLLQLHRVLEKLGAGEHKYHLLFEQASDAIMITDFQGNFIDVNQSLCKMLGYQKEELLVMNIRDVIDAAELVERPIRFDLLAIGQHIFNNRRMIRKNGDMLDVEANVKKFGEGMVMAIARDVTSLRKAQKQIEISESLFRSAFENSAIGMALVSPEGNWLKVNKELLNITGYTEEELMRITFREVTHPEDLDKDLAYMEKAINENIDAYRMEKRYIHKNGSVVWVRVNASLIKDESGKALYYVAQVENISHRKDAELKLRDSEARYRALVDNATEVLVVMDLEAGKFVNVSESALKLFKCTKEKLLQVGPLEVSPENQPDGRLSSESAMEKLIETVKGGKPSFEWTHVDADGNLIPCEICLVRLPSENQILIRGSIFDITERKKAELYKQNITIDLMQRNKDLEQFAYIVSHNLRAPVANILGLTEELQDTEHNIEMHNFFINELESSVKKLDTVIADLNHILQVQRDISEQREKVSFSALISNIRSGMLHLVEKEKVEIHTDFTAIDEMESIRSYLHSIFYNLISNSIKYKQSGTSPVINITSEKKIDKLVFTYSDNGLGIDMNKYAGQVFGLYKRFHQHIEGKGMGLFMVKTQIETLGGKISINSKLNEGTTFLMEFSLP